MMKRFVTLTLLCLLVLGATANRQDRAKGDSIYNRMVELALRDSVERLQDGKEAALAYFSEHEQWDHYYYVSTLCITTNVMNGRAMMTGLQECRKVYEFARRLNHPFTNAHELIDTMTAMVEEHRQGAEPNDDLTMLCLRYTH